MQVLGKIKFVTLVSVSLSEGLAVFLMGKTIAILGATGDQGFGLALRWAKAGESVIIGSRQKSKAEDAVRRVKDVLGSKVDVLGLENPDAAAKASIIVLSVPFAAQVATLESVKASLKEGDIFVNLTVPLATAIGGKASKTIGLWSGSAAEEAAKFLPKNIRIVSAFNNLSAEALQDMDKEVDCDVVVCSDNSEAKAEVIELVNLIPGARAVNGGVLENARIVEQITALLIGLNVRYKTSKAGIRFTGLPLD